MKTLFFASMMLCLWLMAPLAFAQKKADDIIGVWKTGEGNAMVEIKKAQNGKYFGRVVWLKEPNDESGKPKVDKNNPDETKRSRPVLGLANLVNFDFVENGKYENGTIYDPKNGETYNCVMELVNANSLEVRGFIGVSLFGRTDTWIRQQKKN